jgi:hypothetical protein
MKDNDWAVLSSSSVNAMAGTQFNVHFLGSFRCAQSGYHRLIVDAPTERVMTYFDGDLISLTPVQNSPYSNYRFIADMYLMQGFLYPWYSVGQSASVAKTFRVSYTVNSGPETLISTASSPCYIQGCTDSTFSRIDDCRAPVPRPSSTAWASVSATPSASPLPTKTFNEEEEENQGGLSMGLVIGGIVGSVAVTTLLVILVVCLSRDRGKDKSDKKKIDDGSESEYEEKSEVKSEKIEVNVKRQVDEKDVVAVKERPVDQDIAPKSDLRAPFPAVQPDIPMNAIERFYGYDPFEIGSDFPAMGLHGQGNDFSFEVP